MSNTSSRRQFLTNTAKLIAVAPLVAIPTLVPALDDIEFAPTQAPPFGPAERTAAIDRCAKIVDETIQELERFWSFLLEARALSPSEVDGAKLLKLENEAHSAMDSLVGTIECSSDFDDVFKWATGKRSYFWCLKYDIIDNGNFDREFIQREIDAFREDYPGDTAELQALLDARV